MNIITFEQRETALDLIVNGERVDSHNLPHDEQDKLDKLSFMCMRHLNNNAYFIQTEIPGLKENIIKRYFSIDGEDKWSEYFCYLKWYDPNNDWNNAMARSLGHYNAVKLMKANFSKSFAAQTGFNFALITINPDAKEIFEILGIQKID